MHANSILRASVCLVVIALACPLALAQTNLRPAGKRPAAIPAPSATAVASTAPIVPHLGDSDLLVGELTCRQDPFGPDTRITFTAHGTIEVATGGMGELIGRVFSAPEDPCPAINQAALASVQAAGCAAAPTGNDTLTFVCHDRRDVVLGIMAAVSRGVLTGSF